MSDDQDTKDVQEFDNIGNKINTSKNPPQIKHPLLPYGWKCPKCLRINSPIKYECDC